MVLFKRNLHASCMEPYKLRTESDLYEDFQWRPDVTEAPQIPSTTVSASPFGCDWLPCFLSSRTVASCISFSDATRIHGCD
ncbi:hypothetical protein FOCC_FOCC002223, partial [Frankliniella occidentalis]